MKMPKIQINERENQITFWLNTKTYPLEAIYSAAYVFLDRAYIFLDGDPEKEIIVSLKAKKPLTQKELENLKGEFHNELLNYLIRTKITKRNKKIREFIIATALTSALPKESLIGIPKIENLSELSFEEDPLGIAIPWEKKYKKSKSKQDV